MATAAREMKPKAPTVSEALAFDLSYNLENKDRFIKAAQLALKRLALAMGLDNYKISVNAGGIAVGGDVFLFTERLHVQVLGDRFMVGHDVLYRTRKGWDDYSGGNNNYMSATQLDETEPAAALLNKFLEREFPAEAVPHAPAP